MHGGNLGSVSGTRGPLLLKKAQGARAVEEDGLRVAAGGLRCLGGSATAVLAEGLCNTLRTTAYDPPNALLR